MDACHSLDCSQTLRTVVAKCDYRQFHLEEAPGLVCFLQAESRVTAGSSWRGERKKVQGFTGTFGKAKNRQMDGGYKNTECT